MIDPIERSVYRFDHRQAGGLRALDHDHLDAEPPRCLDLPIGRVTAAVLGDDHLDSMPLQHLQLILQAERTPAVDVADVRHGQRRFDGIDAADPVMMLRRRVRIMRLLPPRCQENAQRHIAECSDGLRNAMYGKPVIAFDRHPRRTAQRKGRNSALSSRLRGIGGDAGREGMGGIDHQIDLFIADIAGKSLCAPKPPLRTGTGCGAGSAVRPASDKTISRSVRGASAAASARASVVPPRIRMRTLPMAETPSVQRWLTLIGIGEDGPAGIGDDAKRLIAEARIVFGGARHLDLMGPVITGETQTWLSPFEKSIEVVLARRGKPTVVLASGDPFFYGVGATLSRHIPAAEMTVIPASSSFSLAASRLGWPLQETTVLSLHGRSIDLIRPHLHSGRKILVLTSNGKGPAELAALLRSSGFGPSELAVLEALGGPYEKVSRETAASFSLSGINDLNICGVDVKAEAGARILPLSAGLPTNFSSMTARSPSGRSAR